ncbi:helix-turn-helix domain-containing protein [Streptomyces sp. NPDC059894]|uniref:helix-turn-helix domain-containing protein n=1 Tax=unclassified Streptomyces TaxID=2593676 RepID=UPI003657624E
MAAPPAGPVADFSAALRRTVRACGVRQTEIAEALGLKSATVSELLNGRRKRPPDWDTVRRIVELCARRKGTAPPGVTLDVRWWRSRHTELEQTAQTAQTARTPRGRDDAPPSAVPAPGTWLRAAEYVDMGVEDAVHLLSEGRTEPTAAVDALTARPGEGRGAPPVLEELLRRFPERVRAAHGVARAALVQAARVLLVAAAVGPYGSSRRETAHLVRDLADGAHPTWGSPLAEFRDSVHVETATRIVDDYLRLARPLAAACPEFALLAGLPGPDDRATEAPGTGLAGLGDLLSRYAGRDGLPAGDGTPLRGPIASLDSPGPRLPSLESGYVNPGFRLAARSRGARDGIASDKWWEQQPWYDDLEEFLAAQLLGLPALLTPLVVLGAPGAGKSLLTRLLPARLPASEFRPLRVELRHTPAEADVQTQVEHALKRATGRAVSWPDWSEEEPGPVPVVLLDGFDELLQAGAQRLGSARQWGYLREVAEFQKREARLGRPLIVIVTSRTVVADRAEIPSASEVVRLEPFDEPEIEHWLTVWNTVNAGYFDRHGLQRLTPEVVLPHQELAAHPLLLLMLALYDAVDNALHRLPDEEISRTQLYDRLLREFVHRQVVKDGPLPPAEAATAVERELYQLSVIALSMFHRGAQAVSGEEADRDLAALGASVPGAAGRGPGLLFGRFFFVHEAQAVVTEERLRSYEFMHATFGEHLAARLIDGALGRLVGSHAPSDDGELYALLSFAPLTDRAQLVQNLRDMLAAWPTGRSRTGLVSALSDLFGAAAWDPARRTAVGYAPVRLSRTYRDAVYEVNLALIAVLAAGEVYVSEFVAGESDAVARWRRHAMGWQAQLTTESWGALTAALTLERVRRPDGHGTGAERSDLRLSMDRTRLTQHDLAWGYGWHPSPPAEPLSAELDERLSSEGTATLIKRVLFTGDLDTELLLHVGYPLLLRMPSAFTRAFDMDTRFQVPARALVALLARDLHEPAERARLYTECLSNVHSLAPVDQHPFVEALLRQLVHDVPRLSDEEFAAVTTALAPVFTNAGGLRLSPTAERLLLDVVRQGVDRGHHALIGPLSSLRRLFVEAQHTRDDGDTPLHDLVRITRQGHSTHAWRWWGSPRGGEAADHFDALLADLDLGAVAVDHPSALVDLLRLAAELGLDDWLAAHAAELLDALPAGSFGLLRPSDLLPLRAALPAGAYAEEFEEVERSWRGPDPTSL